MHIYQATNIYTLVNKESSVDSGTSELRRLNIEERVMQRTEMELAKLVHLCAFRGDKGFYYGTCRVGEKYTTWGSC